MQTDRPKIKIPLNAAEIIFEILSIVIILATASLLFINYAELPAKIPKHFNIGGVPDSWGAKSSLVSLFAVIIVFYVLLTIFGCFPHTFKHYLAIKENDTKYYYHNARMLIGALKTEIIALFYYILWTSIQVAKGNSQGLGIAYTLVFLIVIFGTLSFFIVRMIKKKG